MIGQFANILKPWYNEQVSQTLFVHYIEYFTISNVICLVNPQNRSWVLFTITRNSLHRGSLYQGLSVLTFKTYYLVTVDVCNLILQITRYIPISSAIPIRYYKMGKVFGPTSCVALEFSQRGSIELTKSNKIFTVIATSYMLHLASSPTI